MSERVCAVCGTALVQGERERPELFEVRRACSHGCRSELRRRTMTNRGEERLARALEAWSPGADVSRLARHHGVRAETLRLELETGGADLRRPRGRPAGSPNKPKRRPWPPPDLLLEALRRHHPLRVRAAA